MNIKVAPRLHLEATEFTAPSMTKNHAPIVRFAPSPTGNIHIGNARPALFNWLYAKQNKGRFILRFDDTDLQRSRTEYADNIEQDLTWLGIAPDRQERQSERIAAYDAASDRLRQEGVLYPCYESSAEIERKRKRLMARGLPPVYDRSALRLSKAERKELEEQGKRPHWRFLLPNFDSDPFDPKRTEICWNDLVRGDQIVDLSSLSDPVLVREDGSYLYTLPSVVDDIDMGVDHVIRGDDHVTNTGAQIALFQALDAMPPIFGHHNQLISSDGEGFSKRLGSLSVASLREDGLEAMAVASLAALTGSSNPVIACASMDELIDYFDISTISKSPARFNIDELYGLNARLIHQFDYDMIKHRLGQLEADGGEAFWMAVRGNLVTLKDARTWFDIVEGRFEPVIEPDSGELLRAAIKELPVEPWDDSTWKNWTEAVKQKTGKKGRALFMPLRLAMTGMNHGPELALLLPIIGRERTLLRLP